MSVENEAIRDLCAVAKTTNVAIIVGFPEQSNDDVFNTAIVISATGHIIAKHHKVFLFGDTEKRHFKREDSFSTFDIAGHKCGLSICYEVEFPEVVRNFKARGTEIVFVPTANMAPYFDVPTTLVRARALENGLVIVYANLCGAEGDLTYTGQSAIVAPNGKDLVRAGPDEAILIADVSSTLGRNVAKPISTQLEDLPHFFAPPNIQAHKACLDTRGRGQCAKLSVSDKNAVQVIPPKIKGRALAEKSVGSKAYGYQNIVHYGASGEPIRGDRKINPQEADVVRRIFSD